MGKCQYVIYGTGKEAFKYVEFLKNKGKFENIISFVDSDREKWGTKFCDKDVNAPFYLKKMSDVKVIIAVGERYAGEIKTILKMLDIDSENIIVYKRQV